MHAKLLYRMTELETQVVKVQLGDAKQASSYVYTLAEKMDSNDSELYMICELPLFNPAAAQECERIAEAVAASLKRSYRKNITPQTFENALAVINEELGKLVSLGKTHWIGKLNAVIAVKNGNTLSVASAGKISAHLYRDNHFTPISEPPATAHPLKTFENFSEGKMRLNDLLVLSTTQLFNHVSVNRFKQILTDNSLPDAAREIINTLQEAMGPEVACGTIFALQVEPGSAVEKDEAIFGNLNAGPQVTSETDNGSWLDRLKNVSTTATAVGKTMGKDLKERISNRPKLSDAIRNRPSAIGIVQNQFKRAAKQFQPETIKGYSRQKKFFLISAAVLLVALVANVAIARYYQAHKKSNDQIDSTISSMQKNISDANAAFLYGDEAKAASLTTDLENQLNGLKDVPTDKQSTVNDIRNQVTDLENKVNKISKVDAENLGTLSNSNNLIVLPTYFATENNRTVVSYNRSSGSIQDNVLKTSEQIVRSVFWKNNISVIYNGSELRQWNAQTGVIGAAFTDQVPKISDAVGMRLYPTNNRVYIIDKANKQIVSFQITDSTFTKPTTSLKGTDELANASDLAIDGNIYIAANGSILKYNSGAKQDFSTSLTNLSGNTKLYTETSYANLYVMDPDSKKVSILNKNGTLVKTLTSDSFNDMRDFYVDEKGKAIYILNGSSLLRVKF